MTRLRAPGLLLLAATQLAPLPSAAAGPAEKPASAQKLPELPAPPSIELGRPQAAELAELDALLGRIVAEDAQDRDAAVREVLEVKLKHVPAIRFRIGTIADAADKEAMKRLLLKTRRDLLSKKDDAESEQPSAGVDYIARLAEKAEPKSEAWRNLISVLTLARMLESIGTVESVRGLVEVYARYGEFLRITIQNALARLGDKAVPALVEAQRHPAEKISKWATRQLDMLGKGIPSEAVQIQDQAVLADVLRAYGRIRNPEAVRIVVSFANSERAQIREASRQAVALMGEVGSWQLRDTYENVVGKKPPRDWAWERTARELFAEFDRSRVAQVGKLFEEGQAARARGDLAKMRASFDQLLAHDPSFEARVDIAAGYLEFAKANLDKSRSDALAALRRTERLDPTRKEATSLRLALEAEALEDKGVIDSTLLERALEHDPQSSRAKAALTRFERGEPKRSEAARWIAALSILGAAALAIALIFFRRSKPEPKPAPAPQDLTQAESDAASESSANAAATSLPHSATSGAEDSSTKTELASNEPVPAKDAQAKVAEDDSATSPRTRESDA